MFSSFNTPVAAPSATNEPKFDFSAWENKPNRGPVITDLALTQEEVNSLLTSAYGLSEELDRNFCHLRSSSGRPGKLLRTSIVFEALDRDTTFEAIAEQLGVSAGTAYQYVLRVRDAYQLAFGLQITLTKEGAHLVALDELNDQVARLINVFEKTVLRPAERVHKQFTSLQRCGVNASLSARTQHLLNAALSEGGDK